MLANIRQSLRRLSKSKSPKKRKSPRKRLSKRKSPSKRKASKRKSPVCHSMSAKFPKRGSRTKRGKPCYVRR